METVWFCLVAIMVAIYVLLDGFDLGAGAVHFLVAQTDEERRQVIASIGPVWDGNEVWLLRRRRHSLFCFPGSLRQRIQRILFPLMMVLWLLILRGTSIEFRNHIAAQSGFPSGISFSAVPACCWLFSSVPPSATSCAACHSMTAAISSNRCGPISGWARTPASWIGTPFWSVCWR